MIGLLDICLLVYFNMFSMRCGMWLYDGLLEITLLWLVPTLSFWNYKVCKLDNTNYNGQIEILLFNQD